MVDGMPLSDVLLANVKMLTLSELNFLLSKVRSQRAISYGVAGRRYHCLA